MTDTPTAAATPPSTAAEAGTDAAPRRLSPAAERALAEAAARRAAAAPEALPPEVDGRKGPEPVRYGDWEVKGITVDF